MPVHDDDHMVRMFNDTFTVLMERAPVAPTLEEITNSLIDPSRVAALLDQPRGQVDNGRFSDRGDQSIDQSVEADAQLGDEPTVDYLQQRPSDSDTSSDQKRWAGVAVAVAATILVVVGVVVVADGNSGDVVTDPASSPSVDDSVPSNETYEVPEDMPVFRGGEMESVTAGGPGLVAVGSAGASWSTSAAAVWISADGVTWSRVPHDEATFGGEGGGTWMSDVTEGGPGLVAVGISGFDGCCDWAGFDSVVWTSVDGLTWSRVPHDEAVFGGSMMSSVTAGGPGLVAVGVVDSDGDPDEVAGGDADGDAAVWTSVDGITWSRVPDDDAVFGGADNQSMLDVTVGGPGLVAVGVDGQNVWDYSLEQVAAVWTSVDGLTWSRVPDDEAVFGEKDGSEDWDGQVMLGVTSGGPGLVAVGADTSGSRWVPAVWTSVDGISWSRSPYDGEPLGRDEFMISVTDTGRGLVAVGGHWAGGGAVPVWTSADGLTWSRVPDDDIGFGTPTSAGDSFGRGVITAGSTVVAVGTTASDAGVWTSTDGGVTWSQATNDEATREASSSIDSSN